MRKLILCPEIQSYTEIPRSGVVQTAVGAGYVRTRSAHLNTPTVVTVQWKLDTYSEVEYLRAFYRIGISEGTDKFLMDLQGLDQQDPVTALHEYECLMIKDTFQIIDNLGKFIFTYAATLEVKSARLNPSADLAKLISCETLGNVSPFDP